ncbi:SPOR domain-containing protein [Algibacter lectus]|uniref:Sporulation related protein n=1 Tax=Algibacter lectus TaxID=221126 RepID=A0A4R8MFQ6_9FLAO|nr:SPOR domain-containing protein [Algibacter lectus]MDO7136813.1 SPOR domain-containing protein [Algibacter lectus]MWW24714.1 SPOR domain-containing protein [Algibacter lectus]TDY62735.1 sporulation related protein [Algibacter lectus]SFC91946.1 Sporulation related domain-containing protein [Algibacter lectus]
MNSLKTKLTLLPVLTLLLTSTISFSQEGHVSLNQDQNIAVLLDLKKEMNKNEHDSDRYKIQIYSGNRSAAQNAKADFNQSFSEWNPSIEYETPNFKIWAGNFTTRLEADRALKKIKKKFPSAFIFKPKKEKN